MKILDEVIKAFEYTYENDPIAWTYGVDALHYLKEYRDLKSTMDWHKEMEEIRKSLINEPLTWDELKLMEKKPVWVEEIEDDKILFGQWDIISGFGYNENFDLIDYENPIIDFYRSGNRTKFGLGKTWQAYRKERE